MLNFIRRIILTPERIPVHLLRLLLRRCSFVSFKTKLDLDAFVRPSYAYGTYYAALQAKKLGIAKLSVIEFGVAGGNGLVELERIAAEVEKEVGVEIAVYGFDSGTGMPEAKDYRDLPYVWQEGSFLMNSECLKSRLKKAKLILGDVACTVSGFTSSENPAPIGFISFDLDYYSSTVEAFKLFYAPTKFFLPRVFCYFDDCIGDDWQLDSEFAGESLAIKEFNDKNEMRKIARINGLRYKRFSWELWHELMYVLHIFDHPLYCTHINPKKNWQLPLT